MLLRTFSCPRVGCLIFEASSDDADVSASSAPASLCDEFNVFRVHGVPDGA